MFSSLFPLHSFFVSAFLKLFRGVWVLFGASDRPRFPLDGNRTFHPPLSKRQSRHSFRWPGSFPFIAFRSPRPRIGFLIPEFRRYRKGAFPKGNSFSKKGKRFVRFVGLVYLALFLLATLAASFGFLFSENTHFLISLTGVLSLFFSIAIFTFACAFLAKKEETIA